MRGILRRQGIVQASGVPTRPKGVAWVCLTRQQQRWQQLWLRPRADGCISLWRGVSLHNRI